MLMDAHRMQAAALVELTVLAASLLWPSDSCVSSGGGMLAMSERSGGRSTCTTQHQVVGHYAISNTSLACRQLR